MSVPSTKWLLLTMALGGVMMMLRTQASEPLGGGLRAGGALLLVLGMAFLATHGLRRWSERTGCMAQSTPVDIRVLGTKGLGEGRSLMVVEVTGDRFLLAAGRDGVALLSRLDSRSCQAHPSDEGEGV